MKGQSGRTRSRNGANLEHAHLLNQRVILELVRLHGPVSRVDVARLAGLTNQTVFNIVDSLHQIGLIRDFGRKMAERGQPAKLFEINADAAFSVGLHLERDHIASVLVDFKGVIRARTYRARHLSTPADALKQALSAIRELRQKNHRKRILGLGIALPGPMDFQHGKVVFSPNFPGWEQVKVQDYFSRSTKLPVVVDNDATAAAIGESWYGAGRSLDSFVYIYVGVGVGGHEVGGDAVVRQDEVLDVHVVERGAQQRGHPPAAEQRDERQGVVAERIGVDERAAEARRQLLVAPARRDRGPDDRAHAGAADLVDRHARGAQGLDHADMGEGAGATAGHHDADRVTGDQARQPVDIQRHVQPHAEPLEALRILMEDRGNRQRDLIPVFGSSSVVSDVLNGKRSISKTHARKLSEFFRVPASLFI